MWYAAVLPSLADSTVVCDGSAAVDPVAQEASPPHHTGGGACRCCPSSATMPSSVHHSQRPE